MSRLDLNFASAHGNENAVDADSLVRSFRGGHNLIDAPGNAPSWSRKPLVRVATSFVGVAILRQTSHCEFIWILCWSLIRASEQSSFPGLKKDAHE